MNGSASYVVSFRVTDWAEVLCSHQTSMHRTSPQRKGIRGSTSRTLPYLYATGLRSHVELYIAASLFASGTEGHADLGACLKDKLVSMSLCIPWSLTWNEGREGRVEI